MSEENEYIIGARIDNAIQQDDYFAKASI